MWALVAKKALAISSRWRVAFSAARVKCCWNRRSLSGIADEIENDYQYRLTARVYALGSAVSRKMFHAFAVGGRQEQLEEDYSGTTGVVEVYGARAAGGGAGFAFLGSFFILFIALILSFLSVLSLPFRFVFALFRRRKITGRALVRRAVVVGMDGLDPARVRRLMAAGELPNFKSLAEDGSFSELDTTCPPISP